MSSDTDYTIIIIEKQEGLLDATQPYSTLDAMRRGFAWQKRRIETASETSTTQEPLPPQQQETEEQRPETATLRTNVTLNAFAVRLGGVMVRTLAAWYLLKHVEQQPGPYSAGHAKGWFCVDDAIRLISKVCDVSVRTAGVHIERMVSVGLATLDADNKRIFLTGWQRAITDVAGYDADDFDDTNVQIPVKALRKLGSTKAAFTQSWHHENRVSGVSSRSTQERLFGVSAQSLRNYEQTADAEGFTTDVQPVIMAEPLPNTDILKELPPTDQETRSWFKCALCQYASKDGRKAAHHVRRYHPGADVAETVTLARQGANRYTSSLPVDRSGQLGQLRREAANCGLFVSSAGEQSTTGDLVTGEANDARQLFFFRLDAAKDAVKRTEQPAYYMAPHTTQHDAQTTRTRWTAFRIQPAWFTRDVKRTTSRLRMVPAAYVDGAWTVDFVPV